MFDHSEYSQVCTFQIIFQTQKEPDYFLLKKFLCIVKFDDTTLNLDLHGVVHIFFFYTLYL